MGRRLKVALLALGAAGALGGAGCEPQRPAPVRVMALIQTNQGTFAPKEISLDSIGNIVALEGTAARLIGGAKIVLNFSDPLIQASGGEPTQGQGKQIFFQKPRAAPG